MKRFRFILGDETRNEIKPKISFHELLESVIRNPLPLNQLD